ncbi:mannosyl-N-acetyl-alpha-D-glucosaminyl-diphospho-ditrans,octacis-undecaprenol 3-alpha-mannosyltransferase / alpha-1,3-rhamnosyltransferase [Thermoflexales bacterium]|nr:mannosyl-N-acetyl-alpha-D-glucosaminyl-diphospho-ditrans,octacis-undecaprenol 3-alpha-mannosyltransferase / alpha-1,3-rhamnosyltransferase [Thermoflexales bacterium]
MSNSRAQLIGFDATPLQIARHSGVGNYTAQLLTALVDRADARQYVLLANRTLNGETPCRTLGQVGRRFPNRSAWMQWTLPRDLAVVQPDVCHFTNYLAPLRAPCPLVITLHDMSLFVHTRLHPLKSQLFVRPLIPVVARRAAAIITVSQHAKQEIVTGLKISPKKVHVIYEAAAPQYRVITDAAELDRVRSRYELTRPFVLYVGTIEPRKNLARLVAAFAQARRQCPDLELVLVGQLGWKYTAILKAIEDLNLGHAVRRLGYVPNADLPALYTLARLLAFPSVYEGFGLPVVEAMACGTPVLTSNNSSLAEIASGASYLIDPLAVVDIAHGLVCLATDDVRQANLRAAGLARAAEFSWQRAAAETVRVYDSVA